MASSDQLAGEEGYAIAWEEFEDELVSVAAPVHAVDGPVVAALSVSGPSYRLSRETLETIAGHGVEAAARTSERLDAGLVR